jgi:multidrug resistance efflux pump
VNSRTVCKNYYFNLHLGLSQMATEPITVPKGHGAWRSPIANFVMMGISAGLFVWAWQFFQSRASTVVSVDAVVNGNLVDLKSPEEGTLTIVNAQRGEPINAGMVLFSLRNDRVNQLPVQEIKSRANQHRADLQRAQDRLDRLMGLMNVATVDNTAQGSLEQSEVSQRIRQVEAQIEGEQSKVKLAQVQINRLTPLVAAGAVPRASLDVPTAELAQHQQSILALEAQIAELRVNESASQQGLSLSKTRSNYDPRIRVQELQIQIADVRSEIASLQRRVQDSDIEMGKAQVDLKKREQVSINAPIGGVLWKLLSQEGKFVQRGEVLAQLADCQTRWVDALVDEAAVKDLTLGMPANVQLTGTPDNTVMTGKIQTIRSGVGRLAAGEDVAAPVTPNLPRYSQVRVILDPATNVSNNTNQPNSGNLCYIGYTGRVTFRIPEKSGGNTLLSRVWR